jgi:spore maturation protein CgeB
VARGYQAALARLVGDENIRDYQLNVRTEHHRKALHPNPISLNITSLSQLASETVLNEAMYFNADVVFVVSGLNFHPIGLWLLKRAGIHAAAIMTESPYDDVNQSDWANTYPGMTVFTNEIVSAERYGWNYIPHAYDPAIHHPVEIEDYYNQCDVMMVATGWSERQSLLEGVNWEGIDFRLYGVWPMVESSSPIHQFIWPVCIDNLKVAPYYCGSRICINLHRQGMDARSLNPRAFEIAACGAFQISDVRAEGIEVFGRSVPTFTTSAEMEHLIRYYLDPANEQERSALAAEAHRRVQAHTFDSRAPGMLSSIRAGIDRLQMRQLSGSVA